jgi:DNA polymerase-4
MIGGVRDPSPNRPPHAGPEAADTPPPRGRRIAHVDMDAFYASCELSRYPELRGEPMVVGGRRTHAPRTGPDGMRTFSRLRDYAGRGVLTTASYEARAFGVHSAMPTMKAARLAPDAVLLPADFELYTRFSRLFKNAVRSIAPQVQDVGIDEVYADVSSLEGDGEAIAHRIRAAVREASGLTCSVGIAPNKLLAKLASDMNKPDGVTVLAMADVPARIWPMPARKINGIGPKAAGKLAALGIGTVGEIAARDPAWLVSHFGRSYGGWLPRVAPGRDDRPLETSREPVSMSRETTFERDLHAVRDRDELGAVFTRLCEQLAADLQRKGYVCRTVGIKLRFVGFQTVTRDRTLDEPIADATALRRAAGQCLRRVDLARPLRLLGVRASRLERPGAQPRETVEQYALGLE